MHTSSSGVCSVDMMVGVVLHSTYSFRLNVCLIRLLVVEMENGTLLKYEMRRWARPCTMQKRAVVNESVVYEVAMTSTLLSDWPAQACANRVHLRSSHSLAKT